MMNILVTGGTGLIGQALIKALSSHHISLLTRSTANAQRNVSFPVTFIEDLTAFEDFNEFDAIINLAGEPIIDKRWSEKQKGIICSSRWDLTSKLVKKIQLSTNPPAVFISASAVGIYGDQANEEINEHHEIKANNFAHSVCANWEKMALKARSEQTRVSLLRTGIVLSKEGGALKKMLPSFLLGLGGKIGTGKQYYPWIHIEDMVQAIIHILNTENAKGPFNLTAPEPVTNQTFAQSFAKALNRPCFFTVPKFVLQATLGESAHLLLDSQRVIPKKLLESGYQFRFPTIDAAFEDLFP